MTKNTLKSGEQLQNGDRLTSSNGYYEAVMQGDGNFVLYFTPCSYPLWKTGTGDKGADCYLVMQGDGNLVLYHGQPPDIQHYWDLWSQEDFDPKNINKPNSSLVMQDDGNLVVYSNSQRALWSSNTAGMPNPFFNNPDRLLSGNQLIAGQYLISINGLYSAVMQGDGNFVLYFNPCSLPLWNSHTAGKGTGCFLAMQGDGNLVVYHGQPPEIQHSWDSWSQKDFDPKNKNKPGCFLVMQDDGNLVLYQGSSPLWNSHTDKKPEYFYKEDNTVHYRIDWGDLCLNLAKGLAGALPDNWAYGGAIGAVLLDKIFPDKPIDYEKLINDFANIVEEDIKEGFTSAEMAHVNTAKDYMQGEYSHDKKAELKTDLLHDLSKLLLEDINPALNLIESYSHDSKMALGCYLSAVNLKISIRQEMALIDNPNKPNDSDYANLLKTELNGHITSANKIYQDIKSEIIGNRDRHLGLVVGPNYDNSPDYSQGNSKIVDYYFIDNSNKHREDFDNSMKKDPKGRCQTAMNIYSCQIAASYNYKIHSMKFVEDTIDAWRKIAETPIPM